MAVTDYTTYEDVRALLGVSSTELPDDVLSLQVYDIGLTGELYDISPTCASSYVTVSNKQPSARTTAEQWFYDSVRIFAAYAVAKQLTSSLPMFGPKDISDGKATVSRFADSPYRAVVTAIAKAYDQMRARLDKALASMNSTSVTATPRTFFSVVSPSIDPVTGE